MTSLYDLVDQEALLSHIRDGYVKVAYHPDAPLAILNYTASAMFDHVWDHTTINCRGLIYNVDTLEVVARGMRKFFNYEQEEAPKFALTDIVSVADKADGSLGIGYQTPDGAWHIATRGSFTSEQALRASTWDFPHPPRGMEVTPLFEIIYPENRIVVNYGDREGLVPLGTVKNSTGEFIPNRNGVLGTMDYSAALALPPRENAEGLVLTRVSDGAMVKIKQADYLELHRILMGLSARRLWELMRDGKDVYEYIRELPDEFVPWATSQVDDIESLALDRLKVLETAFYALQDSLPDSTSQADFAEAVKASVTPEDQWAMFRLWSGQDIWQRLIVKAKPAGNITPAREFSEDTA